MTSEQKVAAMVVEYLVQLGADVYEEVTITGGVADVVARVSAEVWIVEVKTSLSLALLVQASARRRLAHRVYVAAPVKRGCSDAYPVFAELGLGVLAVHGADAEESDRWSRRVSVAVEAPRLTSRRLSIADKLKPEHKTHARAGAIGGGGRWTPYRDTCRQLRDVVAGWPGVTLREAIDVIRHHYASTSSARSALVARIESGLVPGVRMERDGKLIRLFPSTTGGAHDPS